MFKNFSPLQKKLLILVIILLLTFLIALGYLSFSIYQMSNMTACCSNSVHSEDFFDGTILYQSEDAELREVQFRIINYTATTTNNNAKNSVRQDIIDKLNPTCEIVYFNQREFSYFEAKEGISFSVANKYCNNISNYILNIYNFSSYSNNFEEMLMYSGSFDAVPRNLTNEFLSKIMLSSSETSMFKVEVVADKRVIGEQTFFVNPKDDSLNIEEKNSDVNIKDLLVNFFTSLIKERVEEKGVVNDIDFRKYEANPNSCSELIENFDTHINSFSVSECQALTESNSKVFVGGTLLNISKTYEEAYERNQFTLTFEGQNTVDDIYITSKEDSLPYQIGSFYRFDLTNKCPLITSSASSGNFHDPDLNALETMDEC